MKINSMEKRSRKHRRSSEHRQEGPNIPVSPLSKSTKEVIRDNRRRSIATVFIVAIMAGICIAISITIARLLKL